MSTNIDDTFLLAAFFADPNMRSHAVVVGQYLGIGLLVVVSALASMLALALPSGWIALLGVVPLLLGLAQLRSAFGANGGAESHDIDYRKPDARPTLRSQVVVVAAVTVANGADNIGVYVPLFATNLGAITVYVLTFAVMTGVWCVLGYWLVNNPLFGGTLRRYGRVVLPIVLIALGVYILSGAVVLIR